MAFKKGQSGNPGGRVNDKPWRQALEMALKSKGADKRLRTIAEKVVKAAEKGDMAAIQEIANRLDGRPAQAVDVSNAGDKPFRLLVGWMGQ